MILRIDQQAQQETETNDAADMGLHMAEQEPKGRKKGEHFQKHQDHQVRLGLVWSGSSVSIVRP